MNWASEMSMLARLFRSVVVCAAAAAALSSSESWQHVAKTKLEVDCGALLAEAWGLIILGSPRSTLRPEVLERRRGPIQAFEIPR